MRKIVVCPDSFKGTLTAPEAAAAMLKGIKDVLPEAEVVCLPLGDGGEGTIDALATVLPEPLTIFVPSVDPLHVPIKAKYLIYDGGKALIESASASGLTLVAPERRDIMKADTYGTGLLIADALQKGIRDFIICMGGTATCDGGAGALQALRDTETFISATKASFKLICDVDNPLCGPRGAAKVFGPQKGATQDMIPLLDNRLKSLAAEYATLRGIDAYDLPYAGAAGGLAAMLMACFGANPVKGIETVLQLLDFETHLHATDLIMTGEGRADLTTLNGKAPFGILEVARRHGIPVALVCGSISDEDSLSKAGFHIVEQSSPLSAETNHDYADLLANAARRALLSFMA